MLESKILNSDNYHYKWDNFFFDITKRVAEQSTCLRRKVGAVIVKDKRILTTGYNGAPKNIDHCSITGCIREQLNVPSGQRHELCRAVHAEANAIIQASIYGISIVGATLYCTNFPCSMCAKLIINTGILNVFFLEKYEDNLASELFSSSNVVYTQF